jgi:hypothetical protein
VFGVETNKYFASFLNECENEEKKIAGKYLPQVRGVYGTLTF